MTEDETLVQCTKLTVSETDKYFGVGSKSLSVSETVSLEMTTWSRSSEIVNLSGMELES